MKPRLHPEQRHGLEGPDDDEPSWLVVVLLGGRRYAIDLAAAERVLPMVALTPLPDAPDPVLGAINVHGTVVPVVDLAGRLGLDPVGEDPAARLLLAHTPTRTVAVPVHEVLGAVEVPAGAVLDADAVTPGIHRLDGVVADGEGLLLVHDLAALLSGEEDRHLTAALERATA